MALEIQLIENDVKSFQTPMEAELEKPIKHFQGELAKIRSGRAHTSMIEDIQVSAYGQAPMALKNLASLAAPEARLLTIQPWDSSIIADIERAINTSDLGVKPANDGSIIRIQLPNVSAERREELLKVLNKKTEECRIAIRNIRKDFNNLIRDAKKDKKISENFFNRLSDVLQKVTDTYIQKVDDLSKKKEKDITTL
ncbi:MAG TPA: ribosome recycling factor [Candidatus Dependentiae bacterium]|nr:ribosome recycling factor [Candidatus Dependentiae bacterium]HRQ62576.1 ribosome recycling factor [Candidatus Dependentiae bacterium]